MDRIDRAIIALHDHGSREGATTASVMAAMKRDGFTAQEVAEAAKRMEGEENG